MLDKGSRYQKQYHLLQSGSKDVRNALLTVLCPWAVGYFLTQASNVEHQDDVSNHREQESCYLYHDGSRERCSPRG